MSEHYGPLRFSNCHHTHRPQRSIGSRKYVSLFFEMAFAIATFCSVAVVSAAEIKVGQKVVLEGLIEPGDYNKLRDFLVGERDYGIFNEPSCNDAYVDGCPDEIYLASPGGDLAEAMKIGRLVRSLGWETMAPTRPFNSVEGAENHLYEIKSNDLKDPNSNFMCASACFFIFVGGIEREDGLDVGLPPIVGIHRPYLPTERLKVLSGSQAIATANLARATVEAYLKEMEVPTRYADQIFSVPKNQILWIGDDAFEKDLEGLIPSLRDWMDAKCKLTDVEQVALESINNRPFNKQTKAEQSVVSQLVHKQLDCEQRAKFQLRKEAWQRWRKEILKNIADVCAAHRTSLASELATALSAAKANQQSATVALDLAQIAASCSQYELRESAIRVLATRGDAKAQRILGNLYFFGGSTIPKDRVEGMAWYDHAGAQGDLFAKQFHRDLADKVSNPNHVWTDEENRETGRWIGRNCPALC